MCHWHNMRMADVTPKSGTHPDPDCNPDPDAALGYNAICHPATTGSCEHAGCDQPSRDVY